jgi:hypothetical protein
VAEIEGSCELGGSPGESPGVGCSMLRVAKSRGVKTVVGSRKREDHWIRNPIAYHAFGRLKGVVFDFMSSEVPRAEARRKHVAEPQGGPGK